MPPENNALRILQRQNEVIERLVDIAEAQGNEPGDWRSHPFKGDHSINAGGGNRQRGTTGPQPFGNLGDQLMCVIRAADTGQQPDSRLYQIAEARAASGMSEGVASEGGFALQDNFSDQLLGSVFSDPDVLGKVNKISITKGNNMKIPAVNETSRADGSRQGGVQMYWLAEAGDKTKSKPDLRLLDLELKKLIGLVYLTDELLEDAVALEAFVRRAFQAEMKFQMIAALINGTGAGMPLGIMNSPCLVTQAIETGQATATIVYENITKMWSRFQGDYSKATWHINVDCWPQLLDMGLTIGLGGSPVLLPPAGGSPYMRLMGAPIIPLEQCATLGTASDILLVDWSRYLAIDKGAMQSAASIHVRFTNDETCLRFVYRVDGQPELASAITPYSGSANTLSPFVTLAARP